ncbi:MAG TPA: GNAT family N-acetyltransferase [Candidatus Kapabacteria bacterium]|nr:GNAT family N-acetyltransferase [Candidatus Kapabacteria bacterium]
MIEPQQETLTIRAATEADSALLLRFITQLAEYERLAHAVVATEDDIHAALFGPYPGAEAAIAEYGGRPAGFALFFHNFSTFAGRKGIYLEDLFVLPEFRGRGIGGALLRHLAALAVERGCARMEWAVLDWNEPAIGFYRGMGAEPMDDWTVFRLSGEALHNAGERKR